MKPVKQHFTFEMYSPSSYSETGIPVVDRVSVQMQGDDLPINDVIAKFEDFLRVCGYAAALIKNADTVRTGIIRFSVKGKGSDLGLRWFNFVLFAAANFKSKH